MNPLSHSHITAFEQCPRKYHHYYVLRDVPWETTPAMEKGKDTHKDMQQRIEAGWLSEDGYQCKAEVKLGMREDSLPCDFFAENVWLRGVVDVIVTRKDQPETALILDWKTGKRREDPFELQIHGMLVEAHYPDLMWIWGQYVWLRDGIMGIKHELWKTDITWDKVNNYADLIQHHLQMKHMPPKQGPLCAYCRVKSCEFNHGAGTQGQGRHQGVPA